MGGPAIAGLAEAAEGGACAPRRLTPDFPLFLPARGRDTRVSAP